MKNKNEELLPFYKRASEILNYDTETGIFTRFIKSKSIYKKVGAVGGSGYMQIGISTIGKSKLLSAHRLAWFICYGELPNIIDHIDRNKTNNKITNLRSCTAQQNQFNRVKQTNNTSGFKGVTWSKANKKWVAQINQNGKFIYLGYFNTPQEASCAYETKAKELHGEFYNA